MKSNKTLKTGVSNKRNDSFELPKVIGQELYIEDPLKKRISQSRTTGKAKPGLGHGKK